MNLIRLVLSAIFWSFLSQGALAQQQSVATLRLLERNKMFEPAIIQVAETSIRQSVTRSRPTR